MGGYTLCAECNNNTGTWYADDYINFSNTIDYALNNQVDLEKIKAMTIELNHMYPLRIIKQILCMFASTLHPEFMDAHPELRKFILDKEYNKLDNKKYRVSMYCLKNKKNGWSGLNVMMQESGKIKTVAYMDLYPLGFILEIDPNEDEFNYTSNITNMGTDFTYNQEVSIGLTVNILERNTIYPADFRSKNEIIKQESLSKKKTINIVKNQMDMVGIEDKLYAKLNEDYLNNNISSSEYWNEIEKIKKVKIQSSS